MFKSVRYVGIDDPTRELVDRAMPVLADEIGGWRDEVEVEWDASSAPTGPATIAPSVFLDLRLRLPNSTGIVRRLLTPGDFADEPTLRRACRDAWGRLLDKHLDQGAERLKRYVSEPAEV